MRSDSHFLLFSPFPTFFIEVLRQCTAGIFALPLPIALQLFARHPSPLCCLPPRFYPFLFINIASNSLGPLSCLSSSSWAFSPFRKLGLWLLLLLHFSLVHCQSTHLMTSLRQPGHQYATSFQVLPPCQLHEPSVAPPIPSGIQCSRHMYPCGSLKTNAALIDPGTAAVLHPSASKSNYAPVHASNSVPLHTDPEMYALRNKISDRGQENKAATFFQPQQHHHHHYPFPVVTVKRSTQVNEQAAYVEALVGMGFSNRAYL